MPDPTSGVAGAINLDSALVANILNGLTPTPVSQADLAADASTNGTTYNPPTNLSTDPNIGIKTVRAQMVVDCIAGVSGPIQCYRFVMVGDPFTLS